MRQLTFPLTAALLLGVAGSAFAAGPSQFPSALPPVSNPGECYAQVKIPAQYASGSQRVQTADSYAKLKVTEPEFQRRDETVMIKEPSVRYEVRQPTYRSVSERVLTRPGHDRLSVSAPQFSTVTERLQTSAPHLVWKRGNPGELRRQGYVIHSTADGRLRSSSGYTGGSYASTQSGGDSCGPGCEIWCLVEEPGTSVTTTRRVMSAPSRVIRTPVSPQYRTVTRQVVAEPGFVKEVPIPAEYSTIAIDDLVRPAEAYEVTVPAEFGDVTTKELVSPERYEWRRVLCRPGSGSGTVSGTLTEGGSVAGTTYSGAGSQYSGSQNSGSNTDDYSGTHTVSSGAYVSPTTYRNGYTAGQSYSDSLGYYGSGRMAEPIVTSETETPQPRTGYYGTEDYPAYHNQSNSERSEPQRRVPQRKRR
ncbi:hypothetical protein GCM10011309_18110 [Litorimonas cladophorae]|uniref:Uncharacterized protein n=1 Tax=Litorimonas cladophorae TaxID=1220491 RepID=A0A918NFB2_9PROT|nr:hypothetical protein [Litorimonas cladophorae]GGX68656.1 hypothetical protein GCM10011309_18110 [Litorimonas cladophorae]